MLKKADEDLIGRLVKAGLNDEQIAERMGLHRVTVGRCRRGLGLKGPGRKYPKQEEKKAPAVKEEKPGKTTTARCKGCIYHGKVGELITCDYILLEKRRRGCPAGDECTKFKATS